MSVNENNSKANGSAVKSVIPVWQRKSTLILLAVLAALAVFGTTTQTWIHVAFEKGQVEQADLFIPGNKTSVAVSALALVALAGSLATTIAGKVARIITTVLVLLSAVGIVAVVLGVLLNPGAAADPHVGAATGVIGGAINATTTLFPVIAVIAAVILALAAAMILFFGRRWVVRSKYDTTAANSGKAGPVDDIDSWDQLSRGKDPTD